MAKDRNGTELGAGDWVKCVAGNYEYMPRGIVVQITRLSETQLGHALSHQSYGTKNFVKVERHPHADIIIAAANDMNVEVNSCRGIQVFIDCNFIEYATYYLTDHTLNPPETPEQIEIKRIETEMRKLSDDLAKLRGDS